MRRVLAAVFPFLLLLVVGANAAPSKSTPSVKSARKTAPAAVVSEDAKEVIGKKVREIEIVGLKRIEKDAILAKIQTKKDSAINPVQVRDDIKAIFAMGFFDDVEMRAEPLAGDGAKLWIELRERPVIAEMVFDGNEKVTADDLKDVIKVKEWSILDINKLKTDEEAIQKHYADKGFYLARVVHEIKPIEGKPDQVKLIYKINDYEKVRIKKITFLNNKVFSDEMLKNTLQETREGGLFSFLSGSGNFRESAFKNDLQRLTYWYLDHGYVKFRYENPIVTVSDDKKWLYVSIYVDEGPQYNMGELDFSGDLLFPKDELHHELTLLSGEMFQISKRNADIQKLTEKYQDLGYAFVNVIPKMNLRDDVKLVDIDYSFEKGNLVYIGEIRMAGNSKTHDKVIRRELRVYEGELYNGTRLRMSKERVERLGYFAPGEVIFNTLTRAGRDDLVDIEIAVKERSTGTITLGAGYGSIQKFFLTTQISEINLLGRGQTVSFQAQYAADRLQKSFNLGFTEPYTFDSLWSTGFDLFLINYRIPDRYVLRKLGFDIRVGRPITDDISAFITYKNEGQSIIEFDHPDQQPDDVQDDLGILSSVVWSAVRDVRDNRFETTTGDFQRLTLETAGLGGDKKFLKWGANNRVYFRVVGDLVFKNSTEYGQIRRIQDRPVPPSEKFFLGGPNNMKGFNILSLGPTKTLATGFKVPAGGNVQMFSLFELEHPLIREAGLKWVLFYDIGNAFEHFPGTENVPFTLRMDSGFGIRWFSPIGPLRFEWGFPINRRPGEDTSVFSFFIGPPF